MTTTKPLSPAAQAVQLASAAVCCRQEWGNVNDPPCHPEDPKWKGCRLCLNNKADAAALRAMEDLLAQNRPQPLLPDYEQVVLNERIRLFREITAIAAELEGTP